MTDQLFDISHWNTSADFLSAKQAGQDGVYLKATEGEGYVDPKFATRWQSARAVGLKRGAYLFLNPAQNVPAQVALFIRTLGADKGELKAALDWEDAKGLPVAKAVAAAVEAAALLTKALGYKPLVYTYRSFAIDGYCKGLEGYPLWIADYSGSMHVPSPWKSAVLWQSGQDHVSGIAAGDGKGVDVDFGNLADILVNPPKAGRPASADPVLKLGSEGQKVKDVQHALNMCGNSIPVDGVFGAETDRVLRIFQEHRIDEGLKVTGTTDAATWAALRKVAHANA
jgi:lysozyme